MFSLGPRIHRPTAHLSPLEPNVYYGINKGRSLDNVPPSCVYIGIEKGQQSPPPGGHRWFLFWHTGEEHRRVVEAIWSATGSGRVDTAVKTPGEIPSDLATFCLGHLNRQELDRLDKLATETIPLSRPSVQATHREWVTRVVRAAAQKGLLEEEDMEEGVIAGLAVNW